MRGRLTALVQVLLAVTLVAGVSACNDDKGGGKGNGGASGKPAGAALPQGQETLRQASAAMKDLKSIGFTLTTEGKPAIPVKNGDVKLLKSGDAQGKLQIQQLGLTLETDFVLLGDTLYFKGLTGGGYQKTPKSRITALYDPSAVLDPNRGISKLLTLVPNPQTEAREKVNGKNATRVKVTLPKDSAGALIPGVTQDLNGQAWVADDDHRLLKVRAEMPPAAGGDGGKGAVIIDFTEFNADYKITAPA